MVDDKYSDVNGMCWLSETSVGRELNFGGIGAERPTSRCFSVHSCALRAYFQMSQQGYYPPGVDALPMKDVLGPKVSGDDIFMILLLHACSFRPNCPSGCCGSGSGDCCGRRSFVFVPPPRESSVWCLFTLLCVVLSVACA